MLDCHFSPSCPAAFLDFVYFVRIAEFCASITTWIKLEIVFYLIEVAIFVFAFAFQAQAFNPISHGWLSPANPANLKVEDLFLLSIFPVRKITQCNTSSLDLYFLWHLPYLHVSATIYVMHVIQLLCIVSWRILFVLVQGVLNFYVYFSHGHFF